MRAKWKGKFLLEEIVLFDNKEYYAELDIYNSNLVILNEFSTHSFYVYKGNKFDQVLCNSLYVGFTLSAFVFTKKIANLHLDNRLQRKKRLQKLQMQKKSKEKKKSGKILGKAKKKNG